VRDDPSWSHDQDRETSDVAAADSGRAVPAWFEDFLMDRGTRKPSAHTVKAYRQDFDAIATLVTGGAAASLAPADLTKDAMRRAFACYAATHEPASIRRCWSTWNVLCDFLFTAELIASNPMPLVGRPKAARTLPRVRDRKRYRFRILGHPSTVAQKDG
jgi:integrase/recombinase XerC